MSRKWKKINSRIVYSNPWIKIHEDIVIRPDGKKGIYGFLEKPLANFIIALDSDDCLYLINEYRYPLQKNILQLPAGVADSDDIVQQAKKELYEETGIIAAKWEKIGGFYVAPGHETTFVNVFLATELNLSGLKTDNQESNESILEVIRVKLPKLKQMIIAGKIECGITIAALNLFFLRSEIK
ncbi:MAG: NUDIX hydrolase [Patescibacteria group bacterium]|nr:NUDIX hydrolase [Patescibacteria group bacterium]